MYVYDCIEHPAIRRRQAVRCNGAVGEPCRPRSDASIVTALQERLVRLRGVLAYWYLLWELYTVTYMMEPTEKVVVNIILLSILGLLVWAALTYLPGHLIMVFHFLTGTYDT